MFEVHFDHSKAYEHIRYLADEIGTRCGGTDEEARAADYIRRHFDDLGLKVADQEFEVDTCQLHGYSLTLVESPDLQIQSQPLLMAADTPAGGLEGELVIVEGKAEPAIGPAMRGKIVLWMCPDDWPVFDYPALLKYEPLALLIVEPWPGINPRQLTLPPLLREAHGAVPTCLVSFKSALALAKAQGQRVRITLQSSEKKGVSHNVIGELSGNEFPDEIIIISAHYDSVWGIPGALDNAGGTGIMMELARVFAKLGSKRTLRFLAFGSEELGLVGSLYYIRKLKQQAEALKSHKLCVNLDVQGAVLGQNLAFAIGPPEMTAALKLMSKEVGAIHEVSEAYYGSDGEAMALAGIPAINFGRVGPTRYLWHTPEDSMDVVSAKALGEVGGFVETFLSRWVSQASALPFACSVPEQKRKEIAETLSKTGYARDAKVTEHTG